jgi:hypothetical protein
VLAFHVRCNDAACDLFAGVNVSPSNDGATLSAWLDELLASQFIQIELQTILEANSPSRFGHGISS